MKFQFLRKSRSHRTPENIQSIFTMSNNLVFITGGSGHLGFRTIVTALQAGYSVRAAVRSQSKADLISSAPSIRALNPGSNLSFTIIPDLTIPGAYDSALQGAKYILHIASPIVLKGEIKPENFQSTLIEPAIQGTLSILKAAAKTPSIKRLVITSSVVAQIDPRYFLTEDQPADQALSYKSRTPLFTGPYPTDFHAYNASKIAALLATEEFVRENKLGFDVSNIHPSFIIGKNELVQSAEEALLGTNVKVLGLVLGNKSESPVVGASVHVNDVAYMHVKALDDKVGAGSYVANSGGEGGTIWQDAVGVIGREFKKAVEQGVLKDDGVQLTRRLRIDARRGEEVMGFTFKGYEEQVRSVVGHYLELKGKEVK